MSKQDNTVGNIAIGLAVVVLGFIVYKSFAGGTPTYTGTAPTAAQSNNAAGLAAAVAPAAGGFLSSLFGSGANGTGASASASSLGGALSGMLGGATTTSQLDQTYSSTSYNPDAISGYIAQDGSAAMAAAGESDLNSWSFSL